MKLTEAKFKRRFSVNYYKSLTLPMGEMSFYKNWPEAGKRGDPYPVIAKRGALTESAGDGKYTVTFDGEGAVRRLMGAYFPWATYDVSFDSLCGSVGISLMGDEGSAEISLSRDGKLTLSLAGEQRCFDAPKAEQGRLSVFFRGIGASVYVISGGKETLVCDVAHPVFMKYQRRAAMENAKVLLSVSGSGKTVISRAEWYLTAGISQADLRPVRYEDGTPIVDKGRVFLTASARCVEYKYQVVLSWCPTACDFKLEGAIFFEYDDGYIGADVASSVIYDRAAEEWKIYMCAFSHGHVIGSGTSLSDPRFGISTVEIKLMDEASDGADKTEFLTFPDDEDPDIIHHDGKWYMAICRLAEDGYHYYHFVSEDGGKSYKFLARSEGAEKTGGSYVKTPDGIYFVCGSDFNKRAVYDVYALDDLSTPLSNLCADFDDGGFRGWGSVMLLPVGSKLRYTWITFDRHLGSHFNWSYGNIYVFDSASFSSRGLK